jgi:hypothetical protein
MPTASAPLCLAALLLAVLPLAAKPIRVSGQIQGPAGARVELLPQSGAPPVATATTDPAGLFELTVPESGCFRVRAQMEGHLSLEIPVLAVVEDVDLMPAFPIPVSDPRSREAIGKDATGGWVFAAPVPAAAPPPPAKPRLVQGKVSDAKGSPVPGALVWSESSPAVPFVRAGAEGAFQIRLPASGAVRLRAVAAGYLPSDSREPSAEGAGIALKLEPAGSIAGQVVDAAGHPLAKVQIGVLPVQWTEGRSPRYGTTWSRADGRFRLPSLSPGERYELTAALEGFATASRQAAALPHPVPMRVVLERGATAFGRVLDREKRPVQGAELVLSVNEGAFSGQINPTYEEAMAHATSDTRGSFELKHLNPGQLRLRVKSRGFAPFALPEVEIPPRTARVDLGTLTLDRGLAIEGLVTDPRSVPLPDVEVSLNTQITLFTMGPDSQDSPAQVQTGPDGRFRFDDLRRGAKFEIKVERQGYVPASVRVDVPAPESLTIELKPGRTLAGRVTGPKGEPVRNAILSLREEMKLRLPEGLPNIDGWRHLGLTDEEGKFRAEGVPPGTADLSIFAPGYRSKQPPGIPVPEDRDVEGLEIALEKASALEIRVLDSRGKPVDGAWIEVQRTDSPAPERRGRTDAEGRCLLEGIEPGHYEVSARSEEQGQARTTLDTTDGVTARDLVLAKGVEVSGRVSGESGEPVPGASLSLRPAGKGAALTAHAAADGTFRFQSVGDGTFRLAGSAPDFAETFAPGEVQVAGQEVRGLDLRLSRGATLTGKVLGLDPEELGSVLVLAVRPDQASLQPLQGRVDGQGRYRIEGLGPGDWQVVAHQLKGRSLLEPLQIATGRREAVLDLRFQTGFTLSGQVLVDRAPFAEAQVQAFTRDRSVQAQTGSDGRFQVSNLPADRYNLRVLDLEHGLSATRSVEVTGDQAVTLELATGVLRGRVSSAGGEPIAGAFIRLEEAVPEMPYPFQMPGGTSDAAGAFEIPRIYAGTYRIILEKEGFAAYTANVEVRPGAATPVAIELRQE